MRIKCAKPPLCYDFSNVATYLEQPAVQKALGVTKKWKVRRFRRLLTVTGGS